jgi:Mycothiol maleylpyruvate isomerase N-terminal domain
MGMTNSQHRVAAEVAALLAQAGSSAPPASVRGRLLDAAGAIPSMAERLVPSTPSEVYETQAKAFYDLCLSLTDDHWRLVAAPYGWSVHELVAHVFGGEVYTAQALGLLTDYELLDGSNHLATGTDIIAAHQLLAPIETSAACWKRVQATIERLPELTVDGDNTFVEYHGWPFPVNALLIARGFEFWTHADDIRRAIGTPVESPTPNDLRAMSSTSVQSLELVMAMAFPEAPTGTTRIVLTGAGGGTFDIGPGGERVTTAVLDVVDYCRMAARRLDVHSLSAGINGDQAVAGALWDAAQVFAM